MSFVIGYPSRKGNDEVNKLIFNLYTKIQINEYYHHHNLTLNNF